MENNVESLNKIPFSYEAESYILGSIMIDANLAEEYCGMLSSDDFYLESNKKIFKAIYSLHQSQIKSAFSLLISISQLKNSFNST